MAIVTVRQFSCSINQQNNAWLHVYSGEGTYGPYIVRLASYIPGEILHKVPYVPQTFYNIGKFVAGMHNAMEVQYIRQSSHL